MKSVVTALLALVACAPATPESTADALSAPPNLVLSVPALGAPGSEVTFSVSGAGAYEPVYLAYSLGSGRPPCLPFLGGLCLDLPSKVQLLAELEADASGEASLTVTVPSGVAIGTELDLQAVLIRGYGGNGSVKSNLATMEVSDTPGCTDPQALNFDPEAGQDDGSCIVVPATSPGYAGPAGPDLSDEGWILCSGTASSSTNHYGFYGPCEGASAFRFACSVDADDDAEFTSGTVPGDDFIDGTCDDWPGGSNSNYSTGRILSIDDSDPSCGSFNVNYDLYMDMVSPQWGCAGTPNTNTTGGRMWMYARDPRVTAGCTDPGAVNYDPGANLDDGSCATRFVPGFAGVPGPDLSSQGFLQCAGTSSASTTSAQFYALCGGWDEIVFACSTGADETAEYTSPAFPITGQDLTDGTCDDWVGGSNSDYGPGHILSIDDTDPTCGSFNVAYDLYMDMVSPQWGCAGTFNTHTTGGRMWAWVR